MTMTPEKSFDGLLSLRKRSNRAVDIRVQHQSRLAEIGSRLSWLYELASNYGIPLLLNAYSYAKYFRLH